MLKQSFRMKKVFAILLAVLFVVSLTAVTASAARHGGSHRGGGHHGRGWDHSHPHWYHGQYYPNCDWIVNPYTNQWVWTC